MGKIIPVFAYIAIFVSGAAILIIEILGTRILAPMYGTTTYVWSGLITVTLFALALGYLIGGRLADNKNSAPWFFSLFVISGLAILALFKFRGSILLFSEQYGITYGPLVASFLLFTIPLFILGMVDPFAIKLRTKQLSNLGSRTGFVLAIATAGGLSGALLSAYVLLPAFPISKIFNGLAILLITLGIAGIIALALSNKKTLAKINNLKSNPKKAALLAISIFAVFGSLMIFGNIEKKQNFKNIEQSDRFSEAVILYEKQNLYSLNRVLAVPSLDGVRCFSADGALQTCIDPNNKDEIGYTGKMGLFIEQLPPDSRMLLLGLGGGKVIKEWGRNDIDIDVVDINPATFYATETFLGVEYGDRYSKNILDARRYLRTTDKTYDLILIDVATTLTPPAHFYTQEFFDLLSSRMKDQGITVYLHHEEDPYNSESFSSLCKTVQSVFPSSFISNDGVALLMTMSKNDSKDLINSVNKRIVTVQNKYNNYNNFAVFEPLVSTENIEKAQIITDDHNTVESLWRNKIQLYQRSSILLEEDVQ